MHTAWLRTREIVRHRFCLPFIAAGLLAASCSQYEEPPATKYASRATSSRFATDVVPREAKQRPVRTAAAPRTKPKTIVAQSGVASASDVEPAAVKASPAGQAKVEQLAAVIAAELSARCPTAGPGDQAAFEACRKAMHGDSQMRRALAPVTMWGRQHRVPTTKLSETNLTQFSPDVLTGMYMPLFMFSGASRVEWNPQEQLYRVELGVKFRNRLPPGQFPYPFWHEDEKWKTYEHANALLLWIAPDGSQIRTAQFTPRGVLEAQVAQSPAPSPGFDGKWMWVDTNGDVQPKVTLFDGLYRADNPHLKSLDTTYRELAISLRAGQCMDCHTPNNPYKTKRLVLLQTPAHAAGEIKRVMQSVRQGTMPLDPNTGIEEPLKDSLKGDLLRRASAFEKVVDDAKAWEAAQGTRGPGVARKAADAGNSAPAQ